jgi:hypothetical protein
MITKLAADNEPFTVPPKRNYPVGAFKGKLHFKNLSSEARAKYRVQDENTNEVPVKGELENFPPNNEHDDRIRRASRSSSSTTTRTTRTSRSS